LKRIKDEVKSFMKQLITEVHHDQLAHSRLFVIDSLLDRSFG
jgi:hypothetical protein